MRPHTIRLFIKPFCGWCHEAIRWLDARGISYETLDVTDDPKAMKEMIALSQQRLAPVIEVDGKVLADFGADELEEWWQKQGLGKT
jgi:glutaredoxin